MLNDMRMQPKETERRGLGMRSTKAGSHAAGFPYTERDGFSNGQRFPTNVELEIPEDISYSPKRGKAVRVKGGLDNVGCWVQLRQTPPKRRVLILKYRHRYSRVVPLVNCMNTPIGDVASLSREEFNLDVKIACGNRIASFDLSLNLLILAK
jgi:hypothetical protein